MAQKQYLGLDGHARSKELDEQISLNVASLFSTDGGREVLRYLRSITIESVHGAAVSDAELRHMEGQRYINRDKCLGCSFIKRGDWVCAD